MHLTTQMQAEFETIRKRLDIIAKQVWIPMETKLMRLVGVTPKDVHIGYVINAEVYPYKVRLENMLCDTDCKEQAHSQ